MNGLNAVYRSQRQYLCYTQNHGNVYAITLEWPGRSLALPLEKPRNDLKISLVGREGYLNYHYADNQLHIDLSKIYHNDLPCLYAWTFRIEGLE